MKLKMILLIATVVLTNACTSISKSTIETIAGLPTVQFGEAVPANGEYVLHFPAGSPIDTPVTFGGNLFTEDDTEQLRVTPKQDIYVYRDWLSFDKKTWFNQKEQLKMDLQLELPGYDHPEAGYLILRLNKK